MLTSWLLKWEQRLNLKEFFRTALARFRPQQRLIDTADGNDDLSSILVALTHLASTLTTVPSFVAAAQDIIRVFAIEGWVLWRWDQSENRGYAIMNYGSWSPELDGETVSFEAQSFPAAGRSIGQKVPLVIDVDDPQIQKADRQRLQVWGWTQSLLIPLLDQNRVIGLACLYRGLAERRPFTSGEIMLGQVLAGQAAAALKYDQLSAELESKDQAIRRISQQLVQAQEGERRRISRELHDELGQALTALKINIDLAMRALPENPSARLQRGLGEASRLAEEILEAARNLSLELRPAMLDDLGLLPALRWSLDRYEQRTGQTVHFKANLSGTSLEAALEITLYRLVQEALTNVARHAQARRVWVELRQEAHELIVRVEDDGRGFEVESRLNDPARPDSLGLIGMRERVTMLGGTLHITSRVGSGTWVEARFPLGGREETEQKGSKPK